MIKNLTLSNGKAAAVDSPRFWFGIAIGVLTLYLAVRSAPMVDVKQSLLDAHWRYAGGVLVSVLVNIYAKGVRWYIMLGRDRRRASLGRLILAHMMGQALNMVYPGRVGELSRAYVVGRWGPGKSFVLGTVVVEKLFDLLFFSLLFILVLVLIPLPAWISESTYLLAAVTLAAFLVALLVAYRLDEFTRLLEKLAARLPARLRSWALPKLSSALASLEVLHDRKAFLQLAFWSVVVWATAFFNNYLVFLAFDLDLPLIASLLLLVVLQAGVTIVAVPGRLGLFEYLCILTLARFGVSQASALSAGFLLHALTFFPVLLPGLLSIGYLGGVGSRNAGGDAGSAGS